MPEDALEQSLDLVVSAVLDPIVAAASQWLLCAYPPANGALGTALAEAQVRQAATVAAWLRYPTAIDAALVDLTGPGGCARLDMSIGAVSMTRADASGTDESAQSWRSWVDEVVVSWAACLLSDDALSATAVSVLSRSEHMRQLHRDFRRLTGPDQYDLRSAALVRHPDLVQPIADLHRDTLVSVLRLGAPDTA